MQQSPSLARPAAPLAACVQRISSVDKTTEIHILCDYVDKPKNNWLPRQRPLKDQKTNFRLIFYTAIVLPSPNTENLAEIGPVDFQLVMLMLVDASC